jgi:hypothetical protein
MFGNEESRIFVVRAGKTTRRFPMFATTRFTKTKLALAAALIFGAAGVAQASNENDGGSNTGGYHYGPMGQYFGGPVHHSTRYAYRYRGGPFAFVPGHRRHWEWY